MSEPPEDEWDDELPLAHQLAQMADQARALTDDLAALVTWLFPFAPDDAMEQLQFLYGKDKARGKDWSLATATIALLDRLLAEPEEVSPRLRAFLDETTDDGSQLAALIDWRLARTRKRTRAREGAAPLSVLRALLARLAARTQPRQPVPTNDVVEDAPESQPSAPLYRLVNQTTVKVDELTALIAWLLPFAPEDSVREVEAMKAITRSYRLALFAIQSLDLLLSKPWRSPREHVFGDLSMVAVLIDYRVENERGDRHRLAHIKAQILEVQHTELRAAARRRITQAALGQLTSLYEEEDIEPAVPDDNDDDESTCH